MTGRFKLGDHVTWNSEAGQVSGTIIKIHTQDFDYKGHTHRASEADPQVRDQERQDRPYRRPQGFGTEKSGHLKSNQRLSCHILVSRRWRLG